MLKKLLFTLAGIFTLLFSTHAQDRVFNYTYQSNVLSPQQREIEVWNTFRFQRVDFYRAFQHRVEFETGIARNLQAAFYFIVNNTARLQKGSNAQIVKSSGIAFANEWKLKLSDPVANAFGSAIYTEIELSGDEFEWENKLILDKKLGRHTFALNLVGAYESEKELEGEETENETEFETELDFGYAYNVGKGFNLGLEIRSPNEIKEGDWEHSSLFAGPVISYSRDNFWVNFTLLPQVAGLKGETYKGLELEDHEKLEARLLFSFAL